MVGSPDEPAPLSAELRQGRRVLEQVAGLDLLEDFGWHPSVQRWVLKCRLQAPVSPGGPVPEVTDWYVLIHPDYPAGAIDFYPAKEGGLTATFPHQRFNGEGQPGSPWRDGNICLSTDNASLRRQGFDSEPRDSRNRLRWHAERALIWLSLASEGKLLARGDFFELPDYQPLLSEPLLVFSETEESLHSWRASDVVSGYVELVEVKATAVPLLVNRRFETRDRRELCSPSWGAFVEMHGKPAPVGVWIRVRQPIALVPWQAPATWGELRQHLETQDCDLLGLLAELAVRLRDHGREPNSRRWHPLLLGFPIPERSGEAPRRLHWLALRLPVLSAGEEFAPGFRKGRKGYDQRDRRLFADSNALEWLPTECWSSEELSGRGSLGVALRSMRVALIGAGALGSGVAELLVRGGVCSLTLMDSDRLEAGNLVRHALTLRDVGTNKAEALARRLNEVSPVVTIDGSGRSFPDRLTDCDGMDLVLDVTGEDDVLFHLQREEWRRKHWFASMWLGMHGRRGYCFTSNGQTFPARACLELFEPWREREWVENKGGPATRPGIGCWSPTFPARADDVWLMASILVKHLDRLLSRNDSTTELAVFEQSEKESGVRRIQS